MRIVPIALTGVFLVSPLCADTCLAPKNPVPATVVCGQVFDRAGGFVADLDLQLVGNEGGVAEVHADARGSFIFSPVPAGEYNLTTKSEAGTSFGPSRLRVLRRSRLANNHLLSHSQARHVERVLAR